jgi:GxxExxY protein
MLETRMDADAHGQKPMKIHMGKEAEDLTASIIGAAFEVSNTLGHGFLEGVYRRALVHELSIRGLSVGEEVPFDVVYKEATLGRYYCDLLVEKTIVVELKAIDRLNSIHVGQLLNYLKAGGLKVGLLLNFGRPRLEYQRVLL